MSMLNPAPGFEVHVDDWGASTVAILGRKRTGKSTIARVICEQMYDAGIHWVLFDPKGDAWGIRSSADGQGEGLPILIFGGLHADVAMDYTMGAFMADTVYDQQLTCILDISRFGTQMIEGKLVNTRAEFCTAFARRLFARHQEAKRVIMLVVDEAHQVVPEAGTSQPGMAISLAAWSDLVSMGGGLGLGVTLISQRTASVSKQVLSQIETLIITRTGADTDRKAVTSWADTPELRKEIEGSIASLHNGEAWVLSPHLGITLRVQFPLARTFDSGATPKSTDAAPVPRQATSIDVSALRERMESMLAARSEDQPEDTIEVKALRTRIRSLEEQVLQLSERPVEAERVEVPVEVVPRWMADEFDALRARVDDLAEQADTIHGDARNLSEMATATAAKAYSVASDEDTVPMPPWTPDQQQVQVARALEDREPRITDRDSRAPDPDSRITARNPRDEPRDSRATPRSNGTDTGRDRVMAVLAQFPEGRSKVQLAVQSGIGTKSSTLRGILSGLRKDGFIPAKAEGKAGIIRLTEAGIAAAPKIKLPKGDALLDYWRDQLGDGAPKAFFDILVEAWPRELSPAEAIERSVYEPSSSTVRGAMATLRRLDLVDGWALNPELMKAAGRRA